MHPYKYETTRKAYTSRDDKVSKLVTWLWSIFVSKQMATLEINYEMYGKT